MRTRIIAFVLLAVCLIVALPAQSRKALPTRGPLPADVIRTLVERAPSEEDTPDVDALFLFDGTYITYADGLATLRRQRLIKIYTEWAIDHLGDPRLAYDRSRQELEIHASRTYLLDGSTMDTPENGYNEVTPRGLALSVDHLNIREMVVTHVGIERGVSILLDYSVRDVAQQNFPFNRVFFLHDEFPALMKELVARGDLSGESVNPTAGLFRLPAPESRGDGLIWQVENLKARPRHTEHRLGDQVPWIAIAAAGSWEDLLGDLGRRVDAAAMESGLLDSILLNLEHDAPFLSDRDALERLTETVKDRMAVVRYQPWVFTSLPRTVADCLRRSAATPVERCAILLACCRALDLDATVILPSRWENLSLDVPALEALAYPRVRATDSEGSTWWVDPVGGTVRAQSSLEGGLPYFAVDRAGVERVTAPHTESNVQVSVFWDLEAGEGKAEGTISGPVANTLDWKEPEQLLRDWAEGWCDSAEVTDLKVLASTPEGLSFTVSLKAPLPSPDDRGRTVVDLPMPPAAISELLPEGMHLAHSEVDGILFPGAPVRVHLTWTVRPPDDLVLLPGPAIDMVWEDVSPGVNRTQQGSFVEIGYELDWGGRPVIPQEYGGYRSLFLEATDPRLTRVVFGKEKDEVED